MVSGSRMGECRCSWILESIGGGDQTKRALEK